jgi:hypothetical protein
MSRNRKNKHDSFHKLNEVVDDTETYGYQIQNNNRQKKHKEHKFKTRDEYYED